MSFTVYGYTIKVEDFPHLAVNEGIAKEGTDHYMAVLTHVDNATTRRRKVRSWLQKVTTPEGEVGYAFCCKKGDVKTVEKLKNILGAYAAGPFDLKALQES
jgi:hypothetical protein